VDFYQPSTALKLVQIMSDKGLLDRHEASRPQVFRPRGAEQKTERQMVSDLLDRVSGGSARKLVLQPQSTGYAPLPYPTNQMITSVSLATIWRG
jgi:predicted transcriptional regulator